MFQGINILVVSVKLHIIVHTTNNDADILYDFNYLKFKI